jgi:hypothetical protein
LDDIVHINPIDHHKIICHLIVDNNKILDHFTTTIVHIIVHKAIQVIATVQITATIFHTPFAISTESSEKCNNQSQFIF